MRKVVKGPKNVGFKVCKATICIYLYVDEHNKMNLKIR